MANKKKTRDSKDMKNRLLPEILFMFAVFLIIFNKNMPFKDWLLLSYHQLYIIKLFYEGTDYHLFSPVITLLFLSPLVVYNMLWNQL